MLFWFHTNKKGSRFLVWVVLKCQRQTLKTIWQSSINNLCARTPQTRVGEVGFSLHFWVSVNFYPPNCRFPAPNFSWNLGCFAQGRFQKSFLRSLPLSRLTVERDRTFPTALLRKKVCSQFDMCRIFSSEKKLTVDMFYQWWEEIVLNPAEMQNNLWWTFFDGGNFCRQERSAKESRSMFLRGIDMDIHMYINFLYTTRLLLNSDKVTG
jgi:hypothetical protein